MFRELDKIDAGEGGPEIKLDDLIKILKLLSTQCFFTFSKSLTYKLHQLFIKPFLILKILQEFQILNKKKMVERQMIEISFH